MIGNMFLNTHGEIMRTPSRAPLLGYSAVESARGGIP
jgi:hypothetical protein